MRDYSKVGPRFWTGETGKYLRRLGAEAQVLALYLFTCPNSNMIGLYYLPLTTAAHETGIAVERIQALFPELAEAPSEPLQSPFEGVFARYDSVSESVFVTEMARHQIGDRLGKKDNRHKAVVKELENYRKSPHFNNFLDRYGDCFELQHVIKSKPLQRAFKAPSEPLRSQNQNQEQEQKTLRAASVRGESNAGSEGKSVQIPDPNSPFETWRRDVPECDPKAHETWLEYRSQAGDEVQPHVRLMNARFLARKGSPEQQRAFVDKIIRLQFKRMDDPKWGNAPDPAATKEGKTHAGLPIINP